MTCDHSDTIVKETRHPDYEPKPGKRRFRRFDFPVLIMRQRECMDCKERFITCEVRMDDLSIMINESLKDRTSLTEDILKFLKEQMP